MPLQFTIIAKYCFVFWPTKFGDKVLSFMNTLLQLE